VDAGDEILVDAYGCRAEALRDPTLLGALLGDVISSLDLRVVGTPLVHAFGGAGGVTALYLLQESHLSCHTFPERGYASFNLYCCRPRPDFPWADQLEASLGATRVTVRRLRRGDET
jgi:S-adenosylmethionine decarboxylase